MGAKRGDEGGASGSTTYSFVGERSSRARKPSPSESGERPVDTTEDDAPRNDAQVDDAPEDDAPQTEGVEGEALDGSGDTREPTAAATPRFELDDDPEAAAGDGSDDRDDRDRDDGGNGDAEPEPRDDAQEVRSEEAIDDEASGEDQPLPTLEELDPLVGRGDYATICKLLGPVERAADLPPALALVFAAAHKELRPNLRSAEVNFLAIRSVATLLEVAQDSRIALAIAKRVVRQNPVTGPRPAPPAAARVVLIVLGLAVGIVAGWMAGPGGVQLFEILEAVMR